MDRESKLLLTLYGHLLVMKTFHFQTTSGFRHTKVDKYLSKYLANMDKMLEIIQGTSSVLNTKKLDLSIKMRTDEDIEEELDQMIADLQHERRRSASVDALIDQMQGDIQQLIYLFGFQ